MSEPQLHERLRELLGSARAESCQVVATFLDIRGFSTFSAQGESFDSALYLRSVFTTILSSHFDDAAFFKPTGDGLLLIHELPQNAEAVPGIVSSILSRAVVLVSAFGQITADDFMINFALLNTEHKFEKSFNFIRTNNSWNMAYGGKCCNNASRYAI